MVEFVTSLPAHALAHNGMELSADVLLTTLRAILYSKYLPLCNTFIPDDVIQNSRRNLSIFHGTLRDNPHIGECSLKITSEIWRTPSGQIISARFYVMNNSVQWTVSQFRTRGPIHQRSCIVNHIWLFFFYLFRPCWSEKWGGGEAEWSPNCWDDGVNTCDITINTNSCNRRI